MLIRDNATIKFLKLLQEMRGHISIFLPFGSSTLCEDITFKVLEAYYSGTELSVKNLFSDLPYSIMGTRHHFNKLLKNDWVESKKSDKDARVRLVYPTDKLLEQIDLLFEKSQTSFVEYMVVAKQAACAVNSNVKTISR